MKKRVLAFILCSIMIVTLLPTAAFAAKGDLANVWVGGVQMKADYYLASGASSLSTTRPSSGGFAYLDEDGKTLILDNFDNKGKGYDISGNGTRSSGINSLRTNVTVRLFGQNKISGVSEGIFTDDASLTIYGDDSSASLSVDATRTALNCENVLTVNSANITANGGDKYGLYATSSIFISDSVVSAEADSHAIRANTTIAIQNSNVTATGGTGAFFMAPTLSGFNTWKMLAGASASNTSTVSSYNGEKYVKLSPLTSKFSELWVGGVQMAKDSYLPAGSNTSLLSLTASKPDGGYAYLYPDGKTLILYNYSYSGDGYDYSVINANDISDLEIIVRGTNSITGNFGAIYVGGNLAISGGKLTATAKRSTAIYSDNNISLSDIDLTANGGIYGIFNYGCLDIVNSTVKVTTESGHRSISTLGDISFFDSDVTATGGRDCALYAAEDFTVYDSVVNAKCTKDYGIRNYGVTRFIDSIVTAEGGVSALYGNLPSLGAFNTWSITAGEDSSSASTVSSYDKEKYVKFRPVSSNYVDLWVGGVQMAKGGYLPSGNNPDPTSLTASKPASGGYAYLSEDGKTLTLNNYSYSGKGYLDDEGFYNGIFAYFDKLTILLEGSSSLTLDSYGIWSEGNLSIEGKSLNDKLTVEAGEYAIAGNDTMIKNCSVWAQGKYGFSADALTIANSSVVAWGDSMGLYGVQPILDGNYKITAGSSPSFASTVSEYDGENYVYFEHHDHDYSSLIAPPTCTEIGLASHVCTICEHSYIESLPALGHSYSGGVCTVCGAKDPSFKLTAPVVTGSNNSSTGKVKLTWAAVDGAVKYEVYRSGTRNGTYSKMSTTTNTSYTNTTANGGYTYYYKVRAVDANGKYSDYSSIVCRTCDLAAPSVTGSNDAKTGKVKLTWKKIDGASKYEIYRSGTKNGEYVKLYTTTNTSYTNSTSYAGYTYYYKVKAISSKTKDANSDYSSIVSRTCDCAAPVIKITLNNGDPKLTWSSVYNADSYTIYRATSEKGSYTKMYTTSKTSYTNTSAKAGTKYYYKIVANYSRSDYATSNYSNILSIKAK